MSTTDAIKAFLEVFFSALLVVFYAMFVVVLALYLNVSFDVPGFATVFAGLVPAVGVWAWFIRKRETKNEEAQFKGFQISPEIQARRLEEYEQLLKKKEQPES